MIPPTGTPVVTHIIVVAVCIGASAIGVSLVGRYVFFMYGCWCVWPFAYWGCVLFGVWCVFLAGYPSSLLAVLVTLCLWGDSAALANGVCSTHRGGSLCGFAFSTLGLPWCGRWVLAVVRLLAVGVFCVKRDSPTSKPPTNTLPEHDFLAKRYQHTLPTCITQTPYNSHKSNITNKNKNNFPINPTTNT